MRSVDTGRKSAFTGHPPIDSIWSTPHILSGSLMGRNHRRLWHKAGNKVKASAKILAATLVAGSLGWWATAVQADQVVLLNGNIIEGEIESQDSRFVVIRTQSNQVRIPMNRVAEINLSAPGEVELMRAREALRQDRLEDARRLIDIAHGKGLSEDSTREVLEQVIEREAEQELARYQELIQQAREAASQGRRSEALDKLRALIDQYEEDSPVRLEMIDVLVQYHLTVASSLRDRVRDDEAIVQFQRVLELDPSRARAHIEVADIYRRRNSPAAWPHAIRAYQQALAVGEDTLDRRAKTRIYWEMGELYRQQVNWRDASIYLRKVYQNDPNFNYQLVDRLYNALSSFGRELRNDGNNSSALRVIEEALEIRGDVANHLLRGEILTAMERYEDSIEAYQAALGLAPRTRNANYNIAMNQLELGEIFAARESLEREVEIHPENYRALCDLGDDALNLGDLERAEEFFTKARSVERSRARATLGLARTKRLAEELFEARNLVQEVLSYEVDNLEANLEMGRILMEEGEESEARDFFSKVLELIEDAPESEQEGLRELKADALIARGEIGLLTAGPGTANRDFRSALEVMPDYADAYFSIGNAFRRKYTATNRLPDLLEAERNMRRARELSPENARFALELGILYGEILVKEDEENASKHIESARTQWREYIDLGGSNVAQVERWIANLGN